MISFHPQLLASFLGKGFPYSPPPGQQNCACLCVVKDEAPYIHEYIHHHLHFGFAPIVVLVNRTTDATVAIVRKIAEQHPEVVCLNCDMIDYLDVPAARIQLLGYAYGIAYLRTRSLARYALLSDADEFWFPLDFTRGISDWLRDFPATSFDQISFTWLNQFVREEKFVPPFRTAKASFSQGVKSLVDLTGQIRTTHFHCCGFRDHPRHVDARGRPFRSAPDRPHRNTGPLHDHDAYVLHRIQRSEPEYIATLTRGRPGNHTALKDNRKGYLESSDHPLELPKDPLSSYHQSLDEFVARCGLGADLQQARDARILDDAAVKARIQAHLEHATDKAEALRVLRKIFSGTAHFREA